MFEKHEKFLLGLLVEEHEVAGGNKSNFEGPQHKIGVSVALQTLIVYLKFQPVTQKDPRTSTESIVFLSKGEAKSEELTSKNMTYIY